MPSVPEEARAQLSWQNQSEGVVREIKVDEALTKGKTSVQQDLWANEVVFKEAWRNPTQEETRKRHGPAYRNPRDSAHLPPLSLHSSPPAATLKLNCSYFEALKHSQCCLNGPALVLSGDGMWSLSPSPPSPPSCRPTPDPWQALAAGLTLPPPVSASSLGMLRGRLVSEPADASECRACLGLLGGCTFRMKYEGNSQPWGDPGWIDWNSRQGGYYGRGPGRVGEKTWVPIPYFKGTLWRWRREACREGCLVCTPSGLLLTHTAPPDSRPHPVHSFCICSPCPRDYGDVPFWDRQLAPSPAVLITDSWASLWGQPEIIRAVRVDFGRPDSEKCNKSNDCPQAPGSPVTQHLGPAEAKCAQRVVASDDSTAWHESLPPPFSQTSWLPAKPPCWGFRPPFRSEGKIIYIHHKH